MYWMDNIFTHNWKNIGTLPHWIYQSSQFSKNIYLSTYLTIVEGTRIELKSFYGYTHMYNISPISPVLVIEHQAQGPALISQHNAQVCTFYHSPESGSHCYRCDYILGYSASFSGYGTIFIVLTSRHKDIVNRLGLSINRKCKQRNNIMKDMLFLGNWGFPRNEPYNLPKILPDRLRVCSLQKLMCADTQDSFSYSKYSSFFSFWSEVEFVKLVKY